LHSPPKKLRSHSAYDSVARAETSHMKGSSAETYLANRLVCAGETILARNFRGRGFELDLLTMKQDVLIVVEVKYRSSYNRNNDLTQLVSSSKKKALKKGVLYWLSRNPDVANKVTTIRLDLAVITQRGRQLSNEYYRNIDWDA